MRWDAPCLKESAQARARRMSCYIERYRELNQPFLSLTWLPPAAIIRPVSRLTPGPLVEHSCLGFRPFCRRTRVFDVFVVLLADLCEVHVTDVGRTVPADEQTHR